MAKAKKQEKPIEQRLEEALVLYEKTPYELPSNWCWTTIKSVANVVTGGTPSKKHPEYYGNDFPFFKPADLEAGRNVNRASEYLSEKGKHVSRIIPAQSTAVCCIGSIGKSGYLEVEGTTNQQINSAIPKIDPLYLYYYINTNLFINELWEKSSATTIAIVNKSKMEECYFPLAPLGEQKRIVEIIEKQFAKLDEARDLIQNSLDSFTDRKSAILHKAFTGELTKKWRELHERNTYNWTRKTIGDLFFHTTGKALKKGNTDGILCKYITTSNLYWGRFDFSEVREMYFTEKELEKCTVRKGDLLICNGGDVGRAAIWPYDHKICLQNHISKLRPKEQNLDIRFFFYYFMYLKVKGDIKGKGIGIASLSAKDLLSMQVMLPLLDEQEEIVRILDSIFEKEDKSKELIDMLDKIDEMKKSILARAFRGQLGTSNPTDEPATDLLRKILEKK